ncbi:MAG: adenylosuccinate synthase [Oscillospiraceae bacterium]|nr:adenylosuccinate synthase [Oscillospiraceae bacterium]
MVKAIVGANWGDEGKGKLTDVFAAESDIVIRFQGGANAGHTIINNYGKFALHQLPSGVFHSHITNIIGNGVALNINSLMTELQSVIDRGVPTPKLMISERTQIVMPYHVLFDEYEEERLGKAAFGSTKSGIAPFYSDKYSKIGFQVCELFDEQSLREKLIRVLEVKNKIIKTIYGKEEISVDDMMSVMLKYRDMVAPYTANTFDFLQKAIKENKTILLEGQLGSLRDPDFGIYPMVTSSSTLASYGAIGAGIPAREITEVVAVTKAYSSCVGAGAFTSEIFGDEAEQLRKRGGDGGEYGATTGRPRRMGYFDCVATRYGCAAQGATDVALTCLDVLGYMDEINVCVAYETEDGVTTSFPVTPLLEKAKPVIETLPGWKCDIRGITDFELLPENAKNYVRFIEEKIGFPITIVSNGPGRDEIIYRNYGK